MKKIYFTATNDLSYDQRMHRICNSLAQNGYTVTLVGRKLSSSLPLKETSYKQKRIHCWFTKGKLFYSEFNIRLFFFLLLKKMDAICAVDLDTILPCLFISKLKGAKRIYDAHELFSEMKEVIRRKSIKKIWLKIEKFAVPEFKKGYTVSDGITNEFLKRYNVEYKTIRNLPLLKQLDRGFDRSEKFILYQGAVNEARGFEYLIPAMKWINCKLVICGEGNFMEQLKALIKENALENKIELRGMILPGDLIVITQQAYIGIALAEKEGLNQYYALPNKFFDYIHACVPQVAMDFPEYEKINRQYEVAVLIDDLSPRKISEAVNNLLADDVLYQRLAANCRKARETLNWQFEEKKLLSFYQSVFSS